MAVSAGLVYWILQRAEPGEVLGAMASAEPLLVLGAFALSFVGYSISIGRWRLLLGARGVRPTVGSLLQSYLVAYFFTNLLPSTIGGDAVRIYDSWRFGADKASAVAVIFLERILGLVSLLVLGLGALWFSGRIADRLPLLPYVLVGLLAAVAAAFWLLGRTDGRLGRLGAALAAAEQTGSGGSASLWKRLLRPLGKLRAALLVFGRHRGTVAACGGLSFLLQLNVILQYGVIAAALDLAVPAVSFLAIVPLAILVMMLPVTINGIGLRENAFAFFFGLYGVAAPAAVGFAWLLYGLQLLQAVLGAGVYALRR